MGLFRGDNFIFVHKPKTGGGTITEFLNNKNGASLSSVTGHSGIWDVMKTEEVGDELKFGCIRNPFEWYVSWWSYLKESGRSHHKRMYDELKCWDNFPVFLKYTLSHNYVYGIKYDFEKMLHFNIGIPTYLYINVFCKYDKVYGNEKIDNNTVSKNFLMDKLIEIHDIDCKIPKMFGISTKEWLRYHRKHVTKHNHYSIYYDDECISLVNEKDSILLDEFGYEFEKCE